LYDVNEKNGIIFAFFPRFLRLSHTRPPQKYSFLTQKTKAAVAISTV
jgi:hypothetical protein